jgi:hypothetical protein
MTSSATQTEADDGHGGRLASRLGGKIDLVVGAVIVAVGWLLVLGFNHWHVTAPVVFLCLGWLAMVLCGFFFWSSAMAAATEGTGPDSEGFELSSGRVSELETEKRALLKALKEVEFDREMGKMSEADAGEITRVYRARAIDIIKELEGESEAGETDDAPLDQVIEREVRARMVLAGVLSRRKAAPKQPEPKPLDAAPAKTTPAEAEAAPAPAPPGEAAPDQSVDEQDAASGRSGDRAVERRGDA